MSNIFEKNSNLIFLSKISKLNEKVIKLISKNHKQIINELQTKEFINLEQERSTEEFLNIIDFIKKSENYDSNQELKEIVNNAIKESRDIIVDSVLRDLKDLRKFQKISGNELKNLENFEKSIKSFKDFYKDDKSLEQIKRDDIFNTNIFVLQQEILILTNSLKLNITLLNNFDKDEMKLANLLEKKDKQITREKLQDNIESYNRKLNSLTKNYKKISQDLRNDKVDEFESFINFSKTKNEIKDENRKIDQENRILNTILLNANQFEKAKWNTKGIIKILIEFLFKRSEQYTKNYNKGIRLIEQILKEYAKLSRQFENLEREYSYPGASSKKERHNKERKKGEFIGIKSDVTNQERFEEISNYTKTLIENISSKYKKIKNREKRIKNNKEKIKNLDTRDSNYKIIFNEIRTDEKLLDQISKNQFVYYISMMSSNKTSYKLDQDGNPVKDNKTKEVIKISELEALKDKLKFANKDFEEQNKEFQKLEHRNAGLIQKINDYLFGFDDKRKAQKITKELTSELNLKNTKLVDENETKIYLPT